MSRLFLVLCLVMVGACKNYPRDEYGTYENIKSTNILHVGVIRHEPWAYEGPSGPQGIEIKIVSDFAKSIDVNPQWEYLAEAQATEMLKHHELDLVIGGLTQDSPRKKEVGFTRPYLKVGDKPSEKHVMAASRGENRFIVKLEKFLKARKEQIKTIYEEASNQ